jgi:hypothetical protein
VRGDTDETTERPRLAKRARSSKRGVADGLEGVKQPVGSEKYPERTGETRLKAGKGTRRGGHRPRL